MSLKKNYWQDKNVFITGATGLLGPWLVKELLSQNANVFVLIRDFIPNSLFFLDKLNEKVNVINGDLLDLELLKRILNEFDINTVFHLGAQAIVGIANRSPISTFQSNIQGTWNLLEACRLSPWVKKIIVASSDKAYGEQKDLPYKEDAPMKGRHPYDVSKSCTDLISQSYFHTYNLPVCVTRCGNFFGGGDLHFNRIIPGTIKSVLNDQRPIIRSNGLFIRDYVFVKDVVDAYLTLAEKMDNKSIIGQCFNFSTDKPFNVIEVVDLILEIMNVKNLKPVIQNQACNEIPEQHLCSKKAQELLSWKSKFGVKVGLQETVNWYKNFFKKSGSTYKKSPSIQFSNKKSPSIQFSKKITQGEW